MSPSAAPRRSSPVTRARSVLRDLLSIPTAPFFEQRVSAHLRTRLAALGLRPRVDAFGNVMVRYVRGRGLPAVAFMAHMDHPGFEVVAGGGHDALALWNGAVPSERMAGVRVVVHRPDGTRVKARVGGPVQRSDVNEPRPFPLVADAPVGPGDFGHLDLVPFEIRKRGALELCYTKSADDLGGCASIVLLLERLVAEGARANVLGVFTRAEEVGFYGALGIASTEGIARDTWIVSLETSKTLPQAEIGAGPVIRVGDKARVFDADLLHVLKRLALARAGRDPAFRHQMRVMDGGTCEATPLSLAGYRAAGIAFPLGNYHNVGEGTAVAPEYIALQDVVAGVDLMRDLAVDAVEIPAMLAEQRAAVSRDLDAKLRRLDPRR